MDDEEAHDPVPMKSMAMHNETSPQQALRLHGRASQGSTLILVLFSLVLGVLMISCKDRRDSDGEDPMAPCHAALNGSWAVDELQVHYSNGSVTVEYSGAIHMGVFLMKRCEEGYVEGSIEGYDLELDYSADRLTIEVPGYSSVRLRRQ